MRNRFLRIVLLFVILGITKVHAQVTIGNVNAPQSFSLLELDPTTVQGGLRLPQLTTVQRNQLDISGNILAQGLVIYNMDSTWIEYWDGAKWVHTDQGWTLRGNAGTTSGSNFLGTTDNADLVFKRNKVQAGWLHSFNTGLGVSALPTASTGYFNTGIGNFALASVTSGSTNTALGAQALQSVTTGGANTAIGYATLPQVTTGINNVAVGSNILTVAGAANAIGNVAIGKTALQNGTGNYNVALGYSAGYGGGGSEPSGSYNIYIGANTSLPVGVSSQMNIGNAVFGTGMTGTSGAPAGNIGIGTSAPNSTMQVNGSFSLPINTVTANYTVAATDYTVIANTAGIQITLPSPAGLTGRIYVIVSGGSTFTVDGALLVYGASNSSLTMGGASQYNSITVQSNGTNWIVITSSDK